MVEQLIDDSTGVPSARFHLLRKLLGEPAGLWTASRGFHKSVPLFQKAPDA